MRQSQLGGESALGGGPRPGMSRRWQDIESTLGGNFDHTAAKKKKLPQKMTATQ